MKQFTLTIFLSIFALAGFFNETAETDKAEYLENARLCKIFTKKVEDYKKTKREDFLADATLASYEYRADLFCKKATEEKKALDSDALTDENITYELNTTK
ncbi:MAG TPA: hypothetical protein ENK98_09580 [Epsilonproteobacteria bacterium]|nr:hypothetical protein [Campylobacterota bacterium]